MDEIKSQRLRSQKVPIGIEIDDIGNLEDLLRVVWIDEECQNLKIVNGSGELTTNIRQKKMSDFLPAFRYPLCDKYCKGEHFFNKQVECCESVRLE